MAKYTYYGNIVDDNGTIYNALGNELVRKNGTVRICIKGSKRTLLAGRIVYEAVTGEKVTRSNVILFKDGNKNNAAFENIKIVDRKEYFEGHNWRKKIPVEVQEIIREEYIQTREKYKGSKPGTEQDISVRKLAKKYDCSASTIQKILKETY